MCSSYKSAKCVCQISEAKLETNRTFLQVQMCVVELATHQHG